MGDEECATPTIELMNDDPETIDMRLIAHHRFVLYDHGADVHLHHKRSGVTLHLHSCFFGKDLTADDVIQKLSDCSLSVLAIVHFFEAIEFEPGVSRTGFIFHTLETLEAKSVVWLHALLVADVLGLHIMVEDLFDRIMTRPRVPYSDILDLIDNRHRHSHDVVRRVCELILFARDDMRIGNIDIDEVTRRLAPLADDPDYGICMYGKIIAEAVRIWTIDAATAGAETTQLFYGDSWGPLRDAQVTSAWRVGHAQFFDLYIGNHKSNKARRSAWPLSDTTLKEDEAMAHLPLVVNVDTGYVRRTPYSSHEQLSPPYDICYNKDAETIKVFLRGEHTTTSVFGDSMRNGYLVVVAQEDSDVHLVGEVTEFDEHVVTLVAPFRTDDIRRDQFNCRDVLSIRTGECRGHYRLASGTRLANMLIKVTINYHPTKEQFETVLLHDPMLETANFVVQCEDENRQCVRHGFLVHDWVLQHTWPYFRTVVDAGMSETVEKSVSICGMPAVTLRILMSCLYNGHATDCNHLFSHAAIEVHAKYIAEDGIMLGLNAMPAMREITSVRNNSALNMLPMSFSATAFLNGTYQFGDTSPMGVFANVNVTGSTIIFPPAMN